MKFFPLLLFVVCILLVPQPTSATAPSTYPVYGYNEEMNLCQVKQFDATSEISEGLNGDYWSLRDCRSSNPEIVLNTGVGILIWVILLAAIFVKNFCFAKLTNIRTCVEKRVGVLWESFVVSVVLFFVVLLSHFYSVPAVYYDYGSDVDFILYGFFIDSSLPLIMLTLYLVYVAVYLSVLYLLRGSKQI